MPFTKFTNLDFDQIKTSIKDYLRTNSDFTDFDFEGSNFSVLIDTLAYNTYITAFNSNMIVNESFLDSATLRENVVSLAGNIGYTPRSRTAANAQVTIEFEITDDTSAVTLQPGIVCTGDVDNETFTFAITEPISANVIDGKVKFENINIFQGNYLERTFIFDGSLDQSGTSDLGWILRNFDDNTKVYVISHKQGLDDKFDRTLTVEKEKNFSIVKETVNEVTHGLIG